MPRFFILFWFAILGVAIAHVKADEFEDFLRGNSSGKGSAAQPATVSPSPSYASRKAAVVNEPELEKKIVSSSKNWVNLSANPKGTVMCYSILYSAKRIGNTATAVSPNFNPKVVTAESIPTPKQPEMSSLPYIMVHYFSPYKQRISIFFNYKLKPTSRVFLSIDGKQFELIPFDSFAIAEDGETDAAIIAALLRGKKMFVRGEGDGISYSVDEYNIDGFFKAYDDMKAFCSGAIKKNAKTHELKDK